MARKITYFKTFIRFRNAFFRFYNKIDFILVFFLFLLVLTFTSFVGFKSPLSSISVNRNLARLEIKDFELYRFAEFKIDSQDSIESKSQDSKDSKNYIESGKQNSKDSKNSTDSKSQDFKDSKNITESKSQDSIKDSIKKDSTKQDSIESSAQNTQITQNLIDLYVQGSSIKQFDDNKETYKDFIGEKLDSNGVIERLEGEEVVHIEDEYDFTKGVSYTKSPHIKFFSQFGVYNIKDEIFKGRGEFVIEDSSMKTTGKNIFYDKKADEIEAIEIHSQILK